jgi:hypothetical protein
LSSEPVELTETEEIEVIPREIKSKKSKKSKQEEAEKSEEDIKKQRETAKKTDVIKVMWRNLQYQINRNNFNDLLSATAIKTMGDYLQECQACFKFGGYINTTDEFPVELKQILREKEIEDILIYRSVSKGGSIIPYDTKTGNALRLGIQGDRPSGFRSIYMLLNGKGAVNDNAITGYMFTSSTQNPSRTLLVSRNMGKSTNGLPGNVIYVTRELQIPNKEDLLKSLEFLNIQMRERKVDKVSVQLELTAPTIEGSKDVFQTTESPTPKPVPFKNVSYDDLIDYDNLDKFQPTIPQKQDSKKQSSDSGTAEDDGGTDNDIKKRERAAKKAEKKAAEEAEIQRTMNIIKSNAQTDKITTAFLDTLKPRLGELTIKPDIFDIIYKNFKAQEEAIKKAEDEKLKRQASTEARELAKKKAAEEEKAAKEKQEYNESPEGLRETIDRINVKIEEINTRLSNPEIENKVKTKIKKEKTSLEKELRDAESKLKRKTRGGSTIKKYVNSKLEKRMKFTHKANKVNTNKLTKKHKIIKRPRKTRKNN